MQSKGNAPTAAQKKFWSELVAMGCYLTECVECEIDHMVGASAKQDGHEIGHWWVVPLHVDLHRHGQKNRTNREYEFNETYGSKAAANFPFGVEKEMFMNLCVRYMIYYGKGMPFEPEILIAIMRYGY